MGDASRRRQATNGAGLAPEACYSQRQDFSFTAP